MSTTPLQWFDSTLTFYSRGDIATEESPIFPKQFIKNYASGCGDVQRMLEAEHGNSNVCVAEFDQILRHAIRFIPENHANRKPRLPVEQIHGANAGFDNRKLITPASFPLCRFGGVL